VLAEILEHTGDSTRTQAGVPKGLKRTGKFRSVKMPLFIRFTPILEVAPPVAYAIPASDTQVVRVLQLHGIFVDSLTVPERAQTETFVADSTNVSPRPFQGHHEMQLVGHWTTQSRELPRGTYIVRTAQPQGVLVVYLLEPQSDDGLVTWNFFDRELKPGATYPVMRLMNDIPPGSR
jgi:hypothetical protein